MLEQITRPVFQVMLSDGQISDLADEPKSSDTAARYLEQGGIIYFPKSPFTREANDTEFLLRQHQEDAAYHKNIAYRPLEDRVTGLKGATQADTMRLRAIMSDFCKQAVALVESVFPAYVKGYLLDFASYRPIEERGRKMRLRARNDLIHVDSFPTRPVKGDRILRVFENIHPDRGRVWRTSDPFDQLAQQFKNQRRAPGDLAAPARMLMPLAIMKAFGLKASSGSNYDKWMLDFHNFLKENSEFQRNCRKAVWEFPAGSAWIVYTDMVSHSVLSGQFALEQTFIVSQHKMVLPQKAPINVLRRLYA